ncbi:MAG: hypothetical protein ACRDJP_03020 [Actinomycetota bacterium]
MYRSRMWRRATILAAAAVFGLWGTSVAWAHHKPDHAGGPPASSQVTEDDDSDGVPNAPDPQGDGDNRHPSGKDRHEEGGGSGNQGSSSSEPDGNGHGPERDQGGLDKPDGPGGLDLLDQDGNNGCGNDDDFEDDNEGWCGKPTEQTSGGSKEEASIDTETGETGPVSVVTAEAESPDEAAAVLGVTALAGEDETAPADVLGVVVRSAGPAPAVAGFPLAFTGGNSLVLAAVALILAVAGTMLILLGRRTARV